ncbi:MAG: TonB-dependent receptor [Flavobacteriales bacterium]|nr:TonB-dependent receptor [Flavobacteriales bacterium]MDG1767757.1 TonB-dependent receptor [Flavobacteriales bacterium]
MQPFPHFNRPSKTPLALKLHWCFILSLSFLCFAKQTEAQSQKTYTISGTISDANTGETLIGASIYEVNKALGTSANIYGFYSLSLPADTVELIYSFVGYQPVKYTFVLSKNERKDVALIPGELLGEAEILGNQEERIEESTQMGSITLDMSKVDALPVLLGERDLMKTLQLLPGVQSGTEGASGIYVRGGGPDQNLILLDGVPVYNASHLFGFFSVFNADAIKNVELIKGGFPARYGGRSSSVIDIRMKEGNMKEFKGSGSIGLIASKLTLEGPIKKDKTSFIVSGRRTYIDLLARPFIAANSDGGTGGYFFYDLNTKINHIINEDNRVYLSAYFGRDRAFARYDDSFGDNQREKLDARITWGNTILAARWNRILNTKTFFNLTATYSQYRFLNDYELEYSSNTVEERSLFRYDSGIDDVGLKFDLDYLPNANHTVKAGAVHTYHTFTPGINVFEYENQQEVQDTTFGSNDVYAHEFALWAEDDWSITEKLKVNAGLHLSGFSVRNEFYFNPQVRFAARYLLPKGLSLGENASIKASYSRMVQYLHLLTNSSIGLPIDLWLPVTDQVPQQISDQVSLGYATSFNDSYSLSIEGYYKTMQNLIEYKDGAAFQGSGENWENKVAIGNGEAYGAEVLLMKNLGKFTGWAGYTLSWSWREFDDLNFGNRFPYRYDRRHDIGIALTYKPNDKIDFGFVWVYGTGNAVSLPVARFEPNLFNPSIGDNQFSSFFNGAEYIDERNGYRMPAYHRLDVGVNLHKETKYGQRTWSFGLYNAYNRQNPFFLYFKNEGFGNRGLYQISLFPVIPAFTYNFEF